ncbi:hypothetical protein AAHA92_16942 [Salvia divinorum]|uniref:Uncharacterized protein n=1 Tax=Salvia divinorum TaxID=28513 RepID=A0ABD1GX74_SALDI
MDNQEQENKLEELRLSQDSTRGEEVSHLDPLVDQKVEYIEQTNNGDENAKNVYEFTTSRSSVATAMVVAGWDPCAKSAVDCMREQNEKMSMNE